VEEVAAEELQYLYRWIYPPLLVHRRLRTSIRQVLEWALLPVQMRRVLLVLVVMVVAVEDAPLEVELVLKVYPSPTTIRRTIAQNATLSGKSLWRELLLLADSSMIGFIVAWC